MQVNLRWQLLIAAICLGLVLSLLGFQLQSAGECTTMMPSPGGTLVEGIIGQPDRINPLFARANPVDAHVVGLVFDGLTQYGAAGEIEPALAKSWHFSDDGRQVSFDLRQDVLWHDGRRFTAEDVAFTYGLLQTDEFPAGGQLRTLWSQVAITTTGDYSITFGLPQPYGPFLDAVTMGVLPAHVLRDVKPGALAADRFNRLPTGTGPLLVAAGTDWRQTGVLRLAPNPSYWRGGTHLDGLQLRFYADGSTLAAAFSSGEIHAIADVPFAALPQIAALDGMRLFTSEAPRVTQLLFNLTDTASAGVRSAEVRRALAYGTDRPALIDRVLNGQGLPLDGPYLPSSWAYNPELHTHFDYQPEGARTLLDGAGWTMPEGASVRQQNGQALRLRLLVPDDAVQRALAAELVEQWSVLGIQTELLFNAPSSLGAALALRQYDVALVDVEAGADPDLYDFWSQQAIVSGQNYGGWNNRRASEALEAGRQLVTQEERRLHYDAFQQAYNEDLPALTLFQHVQTYGISEQIENADIGKISRPRDRYATLADWFMLYREVPVSCPEPQA